MSRRPYDSNCDSTKDLLYTICETNKKIKDSDSDNLMVMSMDVAVILPSLHMDDILKGV